MFGGAGARWRYVEDAATINSLFSVIQNQEDVRPPLSHGWVSLSVADVPIYLAYVRPRWLVDYNTRFVENVGKDTALCPNGMGVAKLTHKNVTFSKASSRFFLSRIVWRDFFFTVFFKTFCYWLYLWQICHVSIRDKRVTIRHKNVTIPEKVTFFSQDHDSLHIFRTTIAPDFPIGWSTIIIPDLSKTWGETRRCARTAWMFISWRTRNHARIIAITRLCH